MNPLDLLDLADELLSGNSEVWWRGAVSRAYYAAFHVARARLRDSGFAVPQGDQAHAYLWLRLSNSGHPDVQQAGDRLNELRRFRNWADYDLDQPFSHPTAVGPVQSGWEITRLLRELSSTPAVLARVIDAIKVYERDVLRQVTWLP
jgi:uncharacterized protein (UPF0332 family)